MKKILFVCCLACCLVFSGCYSVFSGGTGGLIVDAESTSSPKAGIANVDVYAYTNAGDRNSDFDKWVEGSVFAPQSDYYGHTTSGTDGSFTISRIVWKAGKPDFGKDADYTEIFLLFYHENYGLTKGSTIIISDSATDTVYAELTKVRKETALTLNFRDVATEGNTGESVYVEVKVPQTTSTLTDALPKTYKTNITGTGVVNISYPRWQSADDKTLENETTPELEITYYQNADIVTWKGCYDGDSENNDYAFRTDENGKTVLKKTIQGSAYSVTLFGKKTRFNVPAFSGQWGTEDGITLQLLRSADGGATYTVDCGSVETASQNLGTNGTQKKGCFNDLGSGKIWFDYSYTGKNSNGYYRITDGTTNIDKTVSSERDAVTIQKD